MPHLRIFAAIVLGTLTLGACATNPSSASVKTRHPETTALTSCQQSKRLPPQLIGAARSGTGQQPVLVVGCAR